MHTNGRVTVRGRSRFSHSSMVSHLHVPDRPHGGSHTRPQRLMNSGMLMLQKSACGDVTRCRSRGGRSFSPSSSFGHTPSVKLPFLRARTSGVGSVGRIWLAEHLDMGMHTSRPKRSHIPQIDPCKRPCMRATPRRPVAFPRSSNKPQVVARSQCTDFAWL